MQKLLFTCNRKQPILFRSFGRQKSHFITEKPFWFVLFATEKSQNLSWLLGWIPRIFRSFFCAKIFYFWPIHMKAHIEKCKTMLKFFRLFLNIHDFFDFFEVFHIIFFCPVSCSHVPYIIRFPMKFYVEAILWGRCATLCKIIIYQKPSKNVILRGLNLRRFTRNQINLHSKHTKITGQFWIAVMYTFMIKRPRILALPTRL